MSDCPPSNTNNSSPRALAVISLSAALMGVGQNGLLVSLPFLVEKSAFSLSTWSILIAIGSFLFLPTAPFWGRFSDKHGPKKVVLQALLGMAVSFSLLCLFSMLSHYSTTNMMCSLGGLVAARILYGCTVSGMVPASQHWALIVCGKERRLQAITAVSIGLSAGRLVGPLISIMMLRLSPFAPLMVMILLPLIALLCAGWIPAPHIENSTEKNRVELPWLPQLSLWPFLLSGLLLCCSIALLQYTFSPLIVSITHWSTEKVSDTIGVLLTISAACTFLTQVLVIKRKTLTPLTMYRLGGVALVLGFMLFLLPYFVGISIAMGVVACGAALLVPAYTSAATDAYSDAQGAVAGYIAMSHTLGYGIASMLAFTATFSPLYPIYLCLIFSIVVMFTAYSVRQTSSGSIKLKKAHES